MQMHDPAHPGELLRKCLPQGMTISEIAKRLRVTRQAFSALLNGRAGVSAEMALRLADAFGTAPDFWLRLQPARSMGRAKAATQDQATSGVRALSQAGTPPRFDHGESVC